MGDARLVHVAANGHRYRFVRELDRIVGLQCRPRLAASGQHFGINRWQELTVALDHDAPQFYATVLKLVRGDLARVGDCAAVTWHCRSYGLLNLAQSCEQRLAG